MFWKIGHRGAAGHEPENTIRSFEKALKLGANVVEFDVRSTKEGLLVVAHDARVDRTTDGRGTVAKMTYTQIRHLRVWGRNDRRYCDSECHIPLLTEALEFFARSLPKNAAINIELKEADIAGIAVNLVQQYGLAEKTVLSAFDYPELEKGDSANWADLLWIKRKEPKIQIVLLTAEPTNLRRALHVAEAFEITAIGLPWRLAGPKTIEDIHRIKTLAMAYLVDDLDEIKILKSSGVDGIVSNFPDRL